ncbi:hypothetical protein VTN96DRAFT_3887 [Rasamsonia emersonii]
MSDAGLADKKPLDEEAQVGTSNDESLHDSLQGKKNDSPEPEGEEKSPENGSKSEFEVWWDEPADQDPANPMNWSNVRKWTIIATVSFITFLTPLASSMFALGVPEVMRDFGSSSDVLASFVVSVFVLGFAFGPLIIAPLSEYGGRVVVYNTCNVLFLVFTILNAVAKNMAMLIVFRFLAGFAGVAAITCGSGTIADLMPAQKRGMAMSLWSLGPLFGPIIGPVADGFLVEAKGWRWVFWVITMASGVATIVCFLVLRETYAPVLLERKAARLRKETGNPAYQSRLHSKVPLRSSSSEAFYDLRKC